MLSNVLVQKSEIESAGLLMETLANEAADVTSLPVDANVMIGALGAHNAVQQCKCTETSTGHMPSSTTDAITSSQSGSPAKAMPSRSKLMSECESLAEVDRYTLLNDDRIEM